MAGSFHLAEEPAEEQLVGELLGDVIAPPARDQHIFLFIMSCLKFQGSLADPRHYAGDKR